MCLQESEAFAAAAALDTHKALVHIFFAQRATKKVKGITDAGGLGCSCCRVHMLRCCATPESRQHYMSGWAIGRGGGTCMATLPCSAVTVCWGRSPHISKWPRRTSRALIWPGSCFESRKVAAVVRQQSHLGHMPSLCSLDVLRAHSADGNQGCLILQLSHRSTLCCPAEQEAHSPLAPVACSCNCTCPKASAR